MKIVEVTGIAGVGKSYVIALLAKKDNFFLDSDIIKKYNLNDFKLLIYFFKNKKSLYIFHAIIKIAFLLQVPLFNKINFIRNSIKKFGKNYFISAYLPKKNELTIVVDEGISHLYQNVVSHKKQNNQKLCKLIDELIEKSNVYHDIIMVTAKDQDVFERLKLRGHKRIKSEIEIDAFIETGKDNIEVLKQKNYTIIQIENNIDGNIELELNKIIGK
jgi:dephospho-CoA kinase